MSERIGVALVVMAEILRCITDKIGNTANRMLDSRWTWIVMAAGAAFCLGLSIGMQVAA